ncbi:MAG: hypothetical protein ACO20Y_08590 [Poseidonia sp.]
MLKGLKPDSELLFISQELTLPDGGVAQNLEVNLPLNTLERQVFVVTDIMAYVDAGWGSQSSTVANQTVDFSWSVSSVDLDNILATGATGNIGNPRVLAAGGGKMDIGATGTAVWREWGTNNATTGTGSDYLGIIATPDYWIRGQYNDAALSSSGRLYVRVVGYMAIASADTYAALVTQEVNSQ